MTSVTKLSDVQLHLLQKTPVQKYVLNVEDMKNFSNVVIKSNAIIDMELYNQDEQRLHGLDAQVLSTAFMMAQCLKQQRAIFDANTVFQMPLAVFFELWKIDFNKEDRKKGFVYRDISESASRLNGRKFVYPDVQKTKIVESGYFSYIKYDTAVIEFGFPTPILEHINLDKQYTWYFLENIIKLRVDSSSYKIPQYAIILYENIQKLKFKSRYTNDKVSVFEISSIDLKKLLGIEPEKYNRHIDFRVKVLDKVVEFIQQRVDMTIEIDNLSMGGRGVNGYRFTAYLTVKDLDFIAAISKSKQKSIMSIAQRLKFSAALASHTTFDSIYNKNKDKKQEFIARIEKELAINDKLVEFEPYLRAVGYKSKKFDAYIKSLDDAVKKSIDDQRESQAQDAVILKNGELPF